MLPSEHRKGNRMPLRFFQARPILSSLRKVRVLSEFSLARYTVDELEVELRKPAACGKMFSFSGPDRRSFANLCKVEVPPEEGGVSRRIGEAPAWGSGAQAASLVRAPSVAVRTLSPPARELPSRQCSVCLDARPSSSCASCPPSPAPPSPSTARRARCT